ncbi:MAG: type IV pilus assembly protein PilM [Gaiellaceae bacterium]
MAKLAVGLKIGASQLSAACVEVNGSARLVQIAHEPIPRGIVLGGEVKDVKALTEALKFFFKRHGLSKRNVRLGISNNRIGVRTIELTGIDDPKQLANAVRFRAQEALPIPVDQAVLDFHVLSETMEEGQSKKRVLLVVAYRELIDSYSIACRQAGIRLAGIDLEAFALLRNLMPPAEPGGERSALVAVSIGSERSTLGVSDGLSCEFARVIEWGGTSLTIALARALNLELEAAEMLKPHISLEGEDVPEGLSPEQAVKAREALNDALQGFSRELVSSLQFYQSQPDSLGIREVVLAGGTASLGGLAPVLTRLVGVNVRVGDPLVGVSVGKKIKGGIPDPSFAVSIGLGMALS